MLMLWTAIIMFVLWILGVIGNVGVGIHMLLFIAVGFFIAWVMHRIEMVRVDEAEHRVVERESVREAERRPQLR